MDVRRILIILLFAGVAYGAQFEMPPVSVPVDIAGQAITLKLGGHLSEDLTFTLRADLTELQSHITPILKAQLDRSQPCGDRISIERGALTPGAEGTRLSVQLSFEKWACLRIGGRNHAKRLAEGRGSLTVALTPEVTQDGAPRLSAEVVSVDADGTAGEVLQSGPAGQAIRDRIRDSLRHVLDQATASGTMLPAAVRPYATLRAAAFTDGGGGQLFLEISGQLRLPADQAPALLDQLRNRR